MTGNPGGHPYNRPNGMMNGPAKKRKGKVKQLSQQIEMPLSDWGADYSYTPYEHLNHQNVIRHNGYNPWREDGQSAPYHRSHPYGFVDTQDTQEQYPHHNDYPSSSVFFRCPPSYPYSGKQDSESKEKKKQNETRDLHLDANISAQKVIIKWDPVYDRKDIIYKVTVECISSACNFQSSIEGNKWTFEQPFTQTQKQLTTTPGNVYRVTVECRDINSLVVLAPPKELTFKACMNIKEHEEMYKKAVHFAGYSMHYFEYLYRCKPRIYWEYIHLHTRGIMKKYIKDNNGQPSNQINEVIHGLFFSARLAPDGTLPHTSPFGDVRMLVHAELLIDPMKHNFYFADFYCNYITHYVTIVVCLKGSDTDAFCYKRLYKMDISQNPFLKITSDWDQYNYRYRHIYSINKKIWVEIYYTEDVPLEKGRFSDIMATGAGTSKIGGLPNNKYCLDCNLFPIVTPEASNTSLSANNDDEDESVNSAFDITIGDYLPQSSTLVAIFSCDSTGLEDFWDDLVEVVCSVIDGACEMHAPEILLLAEDKDVVQVDQDVDQLIKNAEEELKKNIIMTVCPEIRDVWRAVKEHAAKISSSIAEVNELLRKHESCKPSHSDSIPVVDRLIVSEGESANQNYTESNKTKSQAENGDTFVP